jgi:hypothetical protein
MKEVMKYQSRPWGWMLTLFSTKHLWLKILRVKGRTSLQKHAKRTELHVGTSGVRLVSQDTIHRLGNETCLELAWGEPLEEDIVRLEDDYFRQ